MGGNGRQVSFTNRPVCPAEMGYVQRWCPLLATVTPRSVPRSQVPNTVKSSVGMWELVERQAAFGSHRKVRGM